MPSPALDPSHKQSLETLCTDPQTPMPHLPDAKNTLFIPELCYDLADCHIVMDSAYAHLSPEQLFHDAHNWVEVCRKHRRHVYHLQTSHGNFFLKVSTLARKKDRRRFLFLPWRMKTEWRNLDRLRKKAVPAPQRVLFGQRARFPCKAFFMMTEEIQGSELDFRDHVQMEKLAEFVAALHAKNILHQDLHPGNILMDSSGSPVLIDVQEVYCLPWLPKRLKIENLSQLLRHIRSLPDIELDEQHFLDSYNRHSSTFVPLFSVAKGILRSQDKLYRSRAKRCCKNSTEYEVMSRKDGVRGYKQRDFQWSIQDCRAALDHGEIIKNGTVVHYQGICLKTTPRSLLHKNRCLTAWKMNRALKVRGVNVPEALAYFQDNCKNYYLTKYYNESLTLNEYLSSLNDKDKKKAALKSLADWIRHIHSLNIWQRDFKSSNVLVASDKFMMVDLESVQICHKLTLKKKVTNLAQLNASISSAISLKDRLRFFHYYCQELPSKSTRRMIYDEILKITKKKNTSHFGLIFDKND